MNDSTRPEAQNVPHANDSNSGESGISRRTFIQGSGVALASLALTPQLAGAEGTNETPIRVGLVGCGGRGTGAAVNALHAEPRVRLVALADAFADRLESSLQNLENQEVADRVDVPEHRRFVGFDGYQKILDHCDVVLLAAPPHFRPQHIEAAVRAGKHIFAEKPIAVDAPGVRAVMATCETAREKKLSIVSGLCYRYHDAKQELMKRLHSGAIGDIVSLQCTYNTGALWHRGRKPEWSDMEWQLRNWLYFTWLSGDHIVEQSIHSIDKILWAMQDEAPEKCTASGGRIVRTASEYGNVFDHFNSVYQWKNGVRGFHSCRQWADADSEVSDFAFGTHGTAAIQHHRIDGPQAWRFRGDSDDMYESEMKALFGAIKTGEPLNDGDYMCKSTLMAIMARMSAYTGKTISWQQALESKEDLSPPEYAWTDLGVAPVAQPGKTEFL